MSIVTWEFESPPLHIDLHLIISKCQIINLGQTEHDDLLNYIAREHITNKDIRIRISTAYPSSSMKNAEIAQLVEHNLAKVGVASSSLVFRSLL